MKRLITVLNTTLHLQKQAKPGRPASTSSDRALSSVSVADSDNSDVAVVRAPQMSSQPNLGVTFVKEVPTVISVPPPPSQTPPDDTDSGRYGAEPRFQLGAFLISSRSKIWEGDSSWES